MTKKRAIVLLLDSFGLGATADAKDFGDKQANTLGHIAEYCALGKANKTDLRKGALQLPHLSQLGLGHAAHISCGKFPKGFDATIEPVGLYGCAAELSTGKDTPSGHWEIAGVPVLFDWTYFPATHPSFPIDLVERFIEEAKIPGVLGNKHASGTEIINELGDEHIRTGKPILYTSADSVFQVAAHEEHFDVERLHDICQIARELLSSYEHYNVGRVIARPFIGSSGNYTRTANRKDIAVPPPAPTLFDDLLEQNGKTIAIGKTADIFAHRGISQEIKADGNDALFTATLDAMKNHTDDKTLIFSNFVDFDSKYGHRRDTTGYAAALEHFDQRLPELLAQLQENDLLIITADHGCDPTQPGSDHTREHIPAIAYGKSIKTGAIGIRDSFSDIGQSIAIHLNIKPLKNGVSFL
jgi:phosphopentomutase